MKTFLKVFLAIVFVALFAGTIIFLYQKSKEKPVVFETEKPFRSAIVKKTVATGSVVPRKEIEIKPQVSGIIEKLYVEPGDYVHQGDLIAKVRIIPNMVNLNNAESRLNKAKLTLDNARTNFDRQKKLYRQGVISESEYETFELTLKNAEEEHLAAENNLQLIKEGQMKNSEKTANTMIRSTTSGMVLDVPVEEGNSVIESNTFNDGTTIASVADMGEMIFEGKLDESEVGKIVEGMELILTIGAIENHTFKADLEHISPKGVEENGAIQFEIRAAVELNDSVFIRAGYSANADIVLDRTDTVMVIKESLLQFRNDTAFVEVETEPQVFEKRDVEIGLSDGITVEIKSGLEMDDQIKVRNKILK